jgi:hypothetical protein
MLVPYHWHAGPGIGMLILSLTCWPCHWHAGPTLACWSYHWHACSAICMLALPLACSVFRSCYAHLFFLKTHSAIPSIASWRSPTSSVLLTVLPFFRYATTASIIIVLLFSSNFQFLFFILSILVFSLCYLNVHNFMNQLNMSSLSYHLQNSGKIASFLCHRHDIPSPLCMCTV